MVLEITEYRVQSTEYGGYSRQHSPMFSKLSIFSKLPKLPNRQTPQHYNPSTLFDLVTMSHCHRGWGM